MNLRTAAFLTALFLASPLRSQEPATPPAAPEPAAPEAASEPAPAPAEPTPTETAPAPAEGTPSSSLMQPGGSAPEPLFPDPLPEGSAPAPGTADSPELIPEFAPAPAPTVPPGVKASKTSKEAQELTRRIKFRQAKTKADREPAIREHWDRAEAAKTDPEKRDALRAYYNALADRMLKIDGSLKIEIEEKRKGDLAELRQDKVRGSDLPPEGETR